MRILIVDDSKAMRLIVMRTLRQAGFGDHELLEAANGREALARVQASAPDLVLSDWNMPELNGPALLSELRAAGSTVTFGFVTSESTPDMQKAARELGAAFLIVKPFNVQVFQRVLEPVLEGQR
jgi:two-component system, chemotaxis family, chemotaxis protein CheY